MRACCERYDRSTVGDKSPTRDSACSPQNRMHELSLGNRTVLLCLPDNHPSQEPAKVQSTSCKLPPLRTLLGGKLFNGKPPRKIPNPSSFFDNGQGGQPMALGLQALGPLGLWESLAGSVLFPGHDRYYFSTQYCSMQFHRHQSRHARRPHSLMWLVEPLTDKALVVLAERP